jgi:lipid-A-disaccharide synthase
LLQQAKAALVTSGTATLETALLQTPQAVCYRTPLKHLVSFVWKHFFKVPYISLVNLIGEKTIVQELFGKYFSRTQIQNELRRLLCDDDYRQKMMRNYEGVVKKLGKPGAAERAAQLIYSRK